MPGNAQKRVVEAHGTGPATPTLRSQRDSEAVWATRSRPATIEDLAGPAKRADITETVTTPAELAVIAQMAQLKATAAQLRENVVVRTERQAQAATSYESTVLAALQELENNLVALDKDRAHPDLTTATSPAPGRGSRRRTG